MEAFDGVFLCSTNLLDQIDQAAFRRFAFKVRFDVLTAEQRLRHLLATLRELGMDDIGDAAAVSASLAGLAIGDFAAITTRYQLLGAQPTLSEMAEALRGELAFRSPGRRQAGFLK
jgi:SpoVK/Ycf46/Vps4 family AAA+-type ATPase